MNDGLRGIDGHFARLSDAGNVIRHHLIACMYLRYVSTVGVDPSKNIVTPFAIRLHVVFDVCTVHWLHRS